MPPRSAKKTPTTSSAKKPAPKVAAKKTTTPKLEAADGQNLPEEALVSVVADKSPKLEEVTEVETSAGPKSEDAEIEDAEPKVEEETNGEVQENEEAQEAQGSELEEEDVQAGEDDKAGTEEEGDGNGESGSSGSDNEQEDGPEEENGDGEDPSVYMQAPVTERKKEKEFEIFVGGLDKAAVEDDLTKVFGEFGEIQAVRIAKHPLTQKSKGFGFVRYATVEQAKKVLAELKEPEVRGKKVGISASQDNDTLYVGNICKTWTKAKVLEALKEYGVEQIEEMLLPDDSENEGQSKGYAFVEFASHSDAMMAFQRLRKPDAIFGLDKSARVAFAQSSMHPSEETMSQVKTVFVEGLPDSWDEEKVRELCQQYGEIEKIQLSKNFTSSKRKSPKRKDYGFIAFATRECALACVEGINNAEIGEGEVKVRANIAKPQNRGRLAKQGARGGFMVKKDGDSSEGASRQGRSKSKGRKDSSVDARGRSRSKSKAAKGGKRFKSQPKIAEGGTPSKKQKTESSKKEKMEDSQKKAPTNRKNKRNGRGDDANNNGPPPKRIRDNRKTDNPRGRANKNFGKRGNPRFAKHQQARYPARAAPFRSERHTSDLEPHAGYLEPAAKQSRAPIGYGQRRRSVGYESQRRSIGAYGVAAPPPPPSYPADYAAHAGYEPRYGYARGSGYARSAGYY